jgi:hypothetical protein
MLDSQGSSIGLRAMHAGCCFWSNCLDMGGIEDFEGLPLLIGQYQSPVADSIVCGLENERNRIRLHSTTVFALASFLLICSPSPLFVIGRSLKTTRFCRKRVTRGPIVQHRAPEARARAIAVEFQSLNSPPIDLGSITSTNVSARQAFKDGNLQSSHDQIQRESKRTEG